jgi:hypothetical protein
LYKERQTERERQRAAVYGETERDRQWVVGQRDRERQRERERQTVSCRRERERQTDRQWAIVYAETESCCTWTDRLTDRWDKANSHFLQFSELSQKALECPVCYRHRILTWNNWQLVLSFDGCDSEGDSTPQYDKTPKGVLCICWHVGNMLKLSASQQIIPSPFQTNKFSLQG